MIIGNGNIASVIQDREDVIFFASGVSNSSEINEQQFRREIDLLADQPRDKHIVYFSSLSIYRDNSPYNQHKRFMETLVRANFKSYTIIRIEVIAWGKNPSTIHNVFRRKLLNGDPIQITDTFRYIITKDEFLYWLSLIPIGEKNEMNIPGTRYDVIDILKMVKTGAL